MLVVVLQEAINNWFIYLFFFVNHLGVSEDLRMQVLNLLGHYFILYLQVLAQVLDSLFPQVCWL